ncbi:hypothetical protein K7X08_025907 [Anisodus acutangulus]|uniref:Uncharacterized protein n=1 Tax=Anisodus acutangulus TaxID=402998 RepID=A0A9Q1RUN0_9SOLA|nr:hypothetical protein K7X08_025907 [Anisodus acutangulus]
MAKGRPRKEKTKEQLREEIWKDTPAKELQPSVAIIETRGEKSAMTVTTEVQQQKNTTSMQVGVSGTATELTPVMGSEKPLSADFNYGHSDAYPSDSCSGAGLEEVEDARTTGEAMGGIDVQGIETEANKDAATETCGSNYSS